MVINWKHELFSSIQILFAELFFSFSIYFIFFYVVNVYYFPPSFGIGFWIILILVLSLINYFVAKFILNKKKLSKKRNEVILYSSVFVSTISLFMFSGFLETINYSSIKVSSIDNIKEIRNFEVEIKNFEVENKFLLFSRIKRETKPVRIYAEAFYTFPFKPETQNVYYCLLFKKQIDSKLSYSEEQKELESLIKSSKDSINIYNFQNIRNFQFLTKLYREREGFEKTLLEKDGQKFYLLPIKNSLKNEFNETKIFFIKFMIGIFIVYVLLFFLTKVEEWK